MTEQHPEHLREVVSRLMEAQEEALFICNEALETYEVSGFSESDLDQEREALERSEHLRAALEDILATLQGASDDVRRILEGGELG